MRTLLIGLLVVGCGSSPGKRPPPVPVPNEPVVHASRSCAEAAAGIERGTRSVRDPDFSVLAPMRDRCTEDGWPEAALDCFSKMTEDDLGTCARLLDTSARERMFGALAQDLEPRTAVTISIARLASVKVGIAECDRFVATVSSVLRCEGMPIETRVQLGNDTADFWSLPTSKLSADAQRRMADVCGKSLAELVRTAAAAGCQ